MIEILRRKFIRISMLSSALVLILLVGIINVVNYYLVDADMRHTLDAIADTAPIGPGFMENRRMGRGRAPMMDQDRYFSFLFTREGELSNSNLRHIEAVSSGDLDEYLAHVQSLPEGYGYYGNYRYLIRALDHDLFEAVFMDCQAKMLSIKLFALISLVSLAVAILMVYLLIRSASRRAIRPMLDSMRQQRQFITDASHELKTPLTTINTSLKVLEMEVGSSKWLEKIKGQVARLISMVEELVFIARLDETDFKLNMARIDMARIVREEADVFAEAARAAGHPLRLEAPGEAWLDGNESALRKLADTLLDNAVKYASGEGEIFCAFRASGRIATLSVSNPYEGTDIENPDHLFDRFYRADKSRSTKKGSFGIGLSAAKSIVEAHGGRIRAILNKDKTITFTADLPLAQKK